MAQNASRFARLLALLEEGPSTSLELAASAEMTPKICSGYLSQLVDRGLVEVTGRLGKSEPCQHCGYKKPGALAKIYSLVAQKRAA